MTVALSALVSASGSALSQRRAQWVFVNRKKKLNYGRFLCLCFCPFQVQTVQVFV